MQFINYNHFTEGSSSDSSLCQSNPAANAAAFFSSFKAAFFWSNFLALTAFNLSQKNRKVRCSTQKQQRKCRFCDWQLIRSFFFICFLKYTTFNQIREKKNFRTARLWVVLLSTMHFGSTHPHKKYPTHFADSTTDSVDLEALCKGQHNVHAECSPQPILALILQ